MRLIFQCKDKINVQKSNNAICLFLAVLISYQPILLAINTFTNLYNKNTPYDTLIVYLILAVLFIRVLREVNGGIYKLFLVLNLIFIILCLFSLLINPENLPHIIYYFKKYFLKVWLYLFLGFAIKCYKVV